MTTKHPSLAAALITAQQQFTPVKKDNTANTGKFSYTYADLGSVLEAVTPALHANGLVISQLLDSLGTQPAIRTVLMHADSGEQIGGTFPVSCADFNDPQKVGGGVTYARRYALMALLNLNAEDDDATHARQPRSANGNTNTSRNTPQAFTRATESDVSPKQDSGHQRYDGDEARASNRMATEKQLKMIYAVSRSIGYDNDDMKAILFNEYNVESSKDLTMTQATKLIDWLKAKEEAQG